MLTNRATELVSFDNRAWQFASPVLDRREATFYNVASPFHFHCKRNGPAAEVDRDTDHQPGANAHGEKQSFRNQGRVHILRTSGNLSVRATVQAKYLKSDSA